MYSTLPALSLFGPVVFASATLLTNFTRSLQTKPSTAHNHQQQQAAAIVRLPDFHADSPQ
jgi:hypothetical protein